MTYTQNKSKKLLKNKNMCTTFFYFIQTALSFSLLQFPISAMPLPNIKQFFPLFYLFRQCHCHKPIATKKNFPSYFGNAIATNSFPQFFLPSISALPLPLPQINGHFFFFFWEMICPHHFYNIFIANPKWHVVTGCYCWIKKVILVLNSNLN